MADPVNTPPAEPLGLNLPDNLSFEEWRAIGVKLARDHTRLQWRFGDWWAYGEGHWKYGERTALVGNEEWTGPALQTLMNWGSVARAFSETSRRREVLSFTHHAEVAGLPPHLADEMLDWCAEPIAEGGRPRSVRALRAEAMRRGHITVPDAVTVLTAAAVNMNKHQRRAEPAEAKTVSIAVREEAGSRTFSLFPQPDALPVRPGTMSAPPLALSPLPPVLSGAVRQARRALAALTPEERLQVLTDFAAKMGYRLERVH